MSRWRRAGYFYVVLILCAEEERLPYAEGWRPPAEFTQAMMNHAYFEMMKANEHKAEEAKLVGMGTVEALETGVTSMIKGLRNYH